MLRLLLYCTKQPPYLMNLNTKYFISRDRESLRFIDKQDMKSIALNGKIVAECEFEVEEIKSKIVETYNSSHCELSTNKLNEEALFGKSCLTRYEMFNYLQNGFKKNEPLKMPNGYAIHIKNLNIFDKPRITQNYFTYQKDMEVKYLHIFNGKFVKFVENAPQNMMYCYGNNTGEKYILISIRPEWLCKILNGEKTIEVRKKVLKGMIS